MGAKQQSALPIRYPRMTRDGSFVGLDSKPTDAPPHEHVISTPAGGTAAADIGLSADDHESSCITYTVFFGDEYAPDSESTPIHPVQGKD